MENLKIKVNSEAESKEAQELFFELGYFWNIKGREKDYLNIGSFTHLTTFDKYIGQGFGFVDHKEITLPELCALVSLHENPINMDKVLNEVRSDALGLLKDKEYLRRNTGGTYSYVGTVHPDHVHDLLIEIPEGAESYNQYRDGEVNNTFFLRMIGDTYYFANEGNNYSWEWYAGQLTGHEFILWQRYTHPEELPFVDDEPSLNDQYAEIEQVRRASIADTLKERQSTYGDFKDVANTTQYLLQMLSTDAMSDVQLEALHMICSKLARIAHGDPNYKDNWHDIAGYATLVERSL